MSVKALQLTSGIEANQYTPAQKDRKKPEDVVNAAEPKQPETPKDKGISFGEGAGLIAKGFWNKAKGMVTSVVEHPVKSLGMMAGMAAVTTAGLYALPLIGVSAAAGASALAIGFAGFAAYNAAKHGIQAYNHNKNGEYNKTREDLQNLGGDGVDLALSVPFVPKAVKTIKDHAKYTSGIRFNTELRDGLKEAKGFNKLLEFPKADLKIKYEKMTNELVLENKPELEICNFKDYK